MLGSMALGKRLPKPRYLTLEHFDRIVSWLASQDDDVVAVAPLHLHPLIDIDEVGIR
jgi:hypothetical protein